MTLPRRASERGRGSARHRRAGAAASERERAGGGRCRAGRGVASCRRRSRLSSVVRSRSLPTASRSPQSGGEQSPTCARLPSSDVRVAVTGSHGLIGTALLPRSLLPGHEAVRDRPRPARRRRDRVGPAGRPTRPGRRSSASTPSSTSPAPASATSAGPTTTGVRCARAARSGRHARSPTRSPAPAMGRRCCSPARPIGFYGDRGDEQLDETSPPGQRVPRRGRRGVGGGHGAGRGRRRARRPPAHRHRAGRHGGALAQDAAAVQARPRRPIRLRPAVDELDQHRRRGRRRSSTCSRSEVAGPVNLTAPKPVTQRRAGRHHRRRAAPPDRAAGPGRSGRSSLLGGERAEALLFESQRVLPRVLQADGYTFAPPDARAGAARRPRPLTSWRRAQEPVETPAQPVEPRRRRSSGSRPGWLARPRRLGRHLPHHLDSIAVRILGVEALGHPVVGRADERIRAAAARRAAGGQVVDRVDLPGEVVQPGRRAAAATAGRRR